MIRCILVMLMLCDSSSCFICSSVMLTWMPLITSTFAVVSGGGVEPCFRASLQVNCALLKESSGHGESRVLSEGMSDGKMRILPLRI